MNHRSPRPYTIMRPALNPSISKRGALHIYISLTSPQIPHPPTRLPSLRCPFRRPYSNLRSKVHSFWTKIVDFFSKQGNKIAKAVSD